MALYFSPLACSLAARIALYEARADARFIEVDPKTKLTLDGAPFREVNPLGLVPTLRDDAGEILTENAAILQYIAARYPAAELAPSGELARSRLQQWLSFIGTELHKPLFVPLLDKNAPEPVKAYALAKKASRLDLLNAHLTGRQYLLEQFSVADACLVAVLNWSAVTPVELAAWPAIQAYHTAQKQRPSIQRALKEEFALYQRELERHAQSS